MSNILVTGATGQLGYEVVNLLKDKPNINVIATGSKDLDITDKAAVNSFFACNKIDIVIHCAAYTAVDKAEIERDICENINVMGTYYLVENCKTYDCKMVYISTDYVFDGSIAEEYTEESKKNPLSWYGYTKSRGEDLIINNLEKYFIIRTSWVFGINGNNFVKTMLNLAKSDKESVDIVAEEIGSPTYAKDLANYLLELLNTQSFGIYNIHNAGYTNRAEFAQYIFNLVGSKVKINKISVAEYTLKNPGIACRPQVNKLSIDKLTNTLHWVKKIDSWQYGVHKFLAELFIPELPFIRENNITDIKYINYNSTNINYVLDSRYLLKIIYRHSKSASAKYLNFGNAFLPNIVPHVYAEDQLCLGCSYIITDFIPGIPLFDHGKINSNTPYACGENLGNKLFMLHNIAIDKDFNNIDYFSKINSWIESKVFPLITKIKADLPFIDSVIKTYKEGINDLDITSKIYNSLIHVDLNPCNLILTPKNEVAIIDWENITIGNRFVDFKYLNNFYSLDREFHRGFLTGYFKGKPPEEIWKIFKFITALAIIYTLNYQIIINYPDIVLNYKKSLKYYGKDFSLDKPTWYKDVYE